MLYICNTCACNDAAKFYFPITDIDHITGDNFFDVLDNGVIVCRLARVIQEKARSAIEAGRAKGVNILIDRILSVQFISALAEKNFFFRNFICIHKRD